MGPSVKDDYAGRLKIQKAAQFKAGAGATGAGLELEMPLAKALATSSHRLLASTIYVLHVPPVSLTGCISESTHM
eukprot:g30869.t1